MSFRGSSLRAERSEEAGDEDGEGWGVGWGLRVTGCHTPTHVEVLWSVVDVEEETVPELVLLVLVVLVVSLESKGKR